MGSVKCYLTLENAWGSPQVLNLKAIVVKVFDLLAFSFHGHWFKFNMVISAMVMDKERCLLGPSRQTFIPLQKEHPLKSLRTKLLVTGWANLDDRTWATTGTVELELILLRIPSHPGICYVRQLSGLFWSQGHSMRNQSQRDPYLLLRAFRFCFECRKSRIFYRTWRALTVAQSYTGGIGGMSEPDDPRLLTPMVEKFMSEWEP